MISSRFVVNSFANSVHKLYRGYWTQQISIRYIVKRSFKPLWNASGINEDEVCQFAQKICYRNNLPRAIAKRMSAESPQSVRLPILKIW